MLIHTSISIILNKKNISYITFLSYVSALGRDWMWCSDKQAWIFTMHSVFVQEQNFLFTGFHTASYCILYYIQVVCLQVELYAFDKPSILPGKSENMVCHSYRNWENSRDLSILLLWDTKCTLDVSSFKLTCFVLK